MIHDSARLFEDYTRFMTGNDHQIEVTNLGMGITKRFTERKNAFGQRFSGNFIQAFYHKQHKRKIIFTKRLANSSQK